MNIKPFFCEKQKKLSQIILLEDDKIISSEKEVAEIFNTFFLNGTTQNIESEEYNETGDVSITIEQILNKYEHHPSILKIKEHETINQKFTLNNITLSEMDREILNLNTKKSSPTNGIPVKIIKGCFDILSPFW